MNAKTARRVKISTKENKAIIAKIRREWPDPGDIKGMFMAYIHELARIAIKRYIIAPLVFQIVRSPYRRIRFPLRNRVRQALHA